MFLYGDGDAVIVNGDGLDDFNKSNTYQGLLKSKSSGSNLEKFDVVISNPPFSISGFKQDLVNGKVNFSLFNYVSNKSSEIECFFLERTYQLLKPFGYAGIILPLSILNNENRVYVEARKLLLLNFEIVGIIELRDKTFKPTNTTTAGLFLKKRHNEEIIKAISSCIRKIKNSDLGFLEELEFKFPEYNFNASNIEKQLHELNLGSSLKGIGLAIEIILVLANELNKNHKTVVGYSGEKKEQEQFLGYRFTKSRSKESLDLLENRLLYNEDDLNDSSKVNAHILANYSGISLPIPNTLKKHVDYIDTSFLIEKENLVINNPSQYFESESYLVETNSPIGDFIDDYSQKEISLSKYIADGDIKYISGIVYNKKSEVPYKTEKKVITASNLDLRTGRLIFSDKIIYLQNDFNLPDLIKPKKGDIIISNSSGSLKHLGKVVFVDKDYEDCVIGGFLSIIRCNDNVLAKAIFYRMLSLPFRKYITSLRGQNINNMDLDKLKAFKFEIPIDLDSFFDQACKKEEEWLNVINIMNQLRQ